MTDAYTATLAADTIRASSLYNKDLAPVSPERRSWRTYNYAALWISMSVNIPTYMLASGMIAGGMNWKQAPFTVFFGKCLRLVRYSNLDRRRSDQRHARCTRPELGEFRLRICGVLRCFLAAQCSGDL